MPTFIDFPTEVEIYLTKLDKDATALWGMMTAQHAVEHLLLILSVSTGKYGSKIAIETPLEKLPKYKASLMGDYPFPQDFKAPILPKDSLLPLVYDSLAVAKVELLKGIDAFFAYYQENPQATHTHPVFGDCNFEEWKRFHRKHFTHHFAQFGLL